MVMNPWAAWTGCANSCCCTSAVAPTPIPVTTQQSDRGAPWSCMLTMFQANAEVRAAGMVINTMGWVDVLGYELLLHSIVTLRADVVLVVGQDRLYSQLSSELRCGRISTLSLALPCVNLSSCWMLFRTGCDDHLSSKLRCTRCGQLGQAGTRVGLLWRGLFWSAPLSLSCSGTLMRARARLSCSCPSRASLCTAATLSPDSRPFALARRARIHLAVLLLES